ncbi:DUF4254 domain-containing protein [Nocardia macrotermitis]|uniref:DUF4254 domain-containing protein n=1 Tax=Nocardia macrotermitis TaxID=2585198 RepID=UPI0029E7CC14|nr:DUF4254 domain-containing protein [Nocardia macrotermitis]
MAEKLPSKDMLLEACAGSVVVPHPVLRAAQKLGALHRARVGAEGAVRDEIDSARACSVREIDCWVAARMPIAHGAASLHTETVGMVVDRIAQLSVDAHAALRRDAGEYELRYSWRRLAELSVAYGDLAFDVAACRRRLPDLLPPLR